MPQVEITQVASRAERDAFIKFPWRIYATIPAWVPPLLLERKEFLDQKKHPFFEHGAAALFLARRGGEIVGRIMASDDPNYNAEHGSNVGCFGLFESIDDQQVAQALFAAAEDWLRKRGRSEIMGPIDYSTNYVCAPAHRRLRASADAPHFAQPAVLPATDRAARATRRRWIGMPGGLLNRTKPRARLRRIAAALQETDAITIRPVNMKKFRPKSGRLREIYNQAWEKNWGFVPFHETRVRSSCERAEAARDARSHPHRRNRWRAGWFHSLPARHQCRL